MYKILKNPEGNKIVINPNLHINNFFILNVDESCTFQILNVYANLSLLLQHLQNTELMSQDFGFCSNL